jgi:hypothetical protein
MTLAFQGIIKDAVFSVLPSIDQSRTFLPPIARYGGRLGDWRYTTDGSNVGSASSLATLDSALPLNAVTPHVKVAVFDVANIVTPPVDVSGSPVQDRVADTVPATTSGLRFLRFPWVNPHAPDVTSPSTQGTSPNLAAEIANENASGNQNFAYAWWGYVNVPTDGTYTFATSSDDGSVVWIDDVKVVDNDGWHAAVEVLGTPVALRAGKHPIRIGYMNGVGAASFELRWIVPGAATTVAVPASALSNL